MTDKVNLVEELTDIIAILALASMTIAQGTPSTALIGAISSIAVGRQIIKK